MNYIDTSHPGHFVIRSHREAPSGTPATGPGPAEAAEAAEGGAGAARKRKAPASAPGPRDAGTAAEPAQRRRVGRPTLVRWAQITPAPRARASSPDSTPAYIRQPLRPPLAATEPLPPRVHEGLTPPFSPVPFLLDRDAPLDQDALLEPGSPEHQRAIAAGTGDGAGPAALPVPARTPAYPPTPPSGPRPLRPSSRQAQLSPRPPQPTPPRSTPRSQQARLRRAVPRARLPALAETEPHAEAEAARCAVDIYAAPGAYLRTQFKGALQQPALDLQAKACRVRYGGNTKEASLHALDELLMAHRRAIPPGTEAEEARRIETLSHLVGRHTSAQRLELLIARGQIRDLLRTIPQSLITYGLGFMAAGFAQQSLAAQLSPGEPALAGPCPEEAPMPAWVAATLAHLVGDLIVGVGGEVAAAIWRESRLNRTYNSPLGDRWGHTDQFFDATPAGFGVQALSALPFAGAYIAHRMLPEALGPAAWRPAWGAAAAVTAGLGREGLRQGLSWRVNPTWLGGPAPESRPFAPAPAVFELSSALEALRTASIGLCEGASDWARGLQRTLGVPGAKALLNVLGRTFAALVARGGGLVAVAAERQDDPAWKIAADAWLGLSWGLLSTLPSRLTRSLGMALGQDLVDAARRAPAAPARTADAGTALAITPGPAAAAPVLTPGGR